VGPTTGRMLAIFTSAAMESFYRDLAAVAGGTASPPDPAKLMPVLEKHEVAFVGPPHGRG